MRSLSTLRPSRPGERYSAQGVVLAAALSVTPIPAAALEIEVAAGYEVSYSDNVTNESDGISDWLHRPQLAFKATHESTDYSLSADYILLHRVYADDTYPEDTTVNGTTAARVTLLPSVVDWTFSHSSTENPVDSRGGNVPTNRQTTTVLATGPDIRLDLSPRMQASIVARVQDVVSDRTGNDSSRWIAQGQLQRVLSPGTLIGISVAHSDVDFDVEFGRDFRTTDGRLTFLREHTARLRFELQAGAVLVKNDPFPVFTPIGVVQRDGDDTVDWTGSADIQYLFPAGWVANVSGERQVIDQGAQLGAGIVDFDGAGNSRSDQRESFLQERIGFGLERSEGRLRGRLAVDRVIQEYDGLREDEERRRAIVSLDYQLGPRLRGQGRIVREEIEFADTDGTDVRRNVGLRLGYEPFRQLSVSLSLEWEDRDVPDGTGDGYDETRVTLGTLYRLR